MSQDVIYCAVVELNKKMLYVYISLVQGVKMDKHSDRFAIKCKSLIAGDYALTDFLKLISSLEKFKDLQLWFTLGVIL